MHDSSSAPAPPGATRCLKAAGPRSVWLVQSDGRLRTVKTWPLTVGVAARLLLGIAQPQRHRRGRRRLTDAGVASPAVRAIRFVSRGRLLVELEADYVEGSTAMELFGADQLGVERAARLGELVARLAGSHLLNRDLKLSNIVFGADDSLWVIDPVGIRGTNDLVLAIERMLDRLAVEPAATGVPVSRAVIRAVLRAAYRDRREQHRAARQRRARRHRH